ncbi:MAG: primosomal protein N' [Defluviitaleaceae bacterium]|nr:primosomal protein N' [Defluviitaleaceae bacterium]
MTKYVEVILPGSIDKPFTYAVSDCLDVSIGTCVIVPFGKYNREQEAYVTGIVEKPEFKLKQIRKLSDDNLIPIDLMQIAVWMADKYYTTLTSCLKAILPAGIKKIKKIKEVILTEVTNVDKVELNKEQRQIVESILKNSKNSKKPILIHGVTGSGKTEVYMEIIEYCIGNGKEAIVLVPEIALTPQTVSRFKKRFGDVLGATHSRLSAGERKALWHAAKNGQIKVMIGPRSAIFTPFDNIGAIILDEEHEHTYKSEQSPKYDAREVAIKRADSHNALVIMASATPSIESYYFAKNGEYHLEVLEKRVNNTPPEINVVDMRLELMKGNTSIFSKELEVAIKNNLENNFQTILFLNRRGYSTFVSCRNCGYTLKCDNCDINFTYHKYTDSLLCHYCGKADKTPENCPVCASKYIRYFGIGTQRVENELKELFPDAEIFRADLDTTTKKNSHEKIFNEFKNTKNGILVGTQMIAKGLDFPRVTVVGIISADISLGAGDYRSAEQTFSLLTQVSGRAGRAEHKGRVFIQTYNPEHYSIVHAKDANYENFYKEEILLRKARNYPPYSHIFVILLSSEDERHLIQSIFKFNQILKFYASKRDIFEILGPAPASLSKINNRFRQKIIIKCKLEENLKNFVLFTLQKASYEIKNISVSISHNPHIVP